MGLTKSYDINIDNNNRWFLFINAQFMGWMKCDHIKRLITLTSDYIKPLSLYYALPDVVFVELDLATPYLSPMCAAQLCHTRWSKSRRQSIECPSDFNRKQLFKRLKAHGMSVQNDPVFPSRVVLRISPLFCLNGCLIGLNFN